MDQPNTGAQCGVYKIYNSDSSAQICDESPIDSSRKNNDDNVVWHKVEILDDAVLALLPDSKMDNLIRKMRIITKKLNDLGRTFRKNANKLLETTVSLMQKFDDAYYHRRFRVGQETCSWFYMPSSNVVTKKMQRMIAEESPGTLEKTGRNDPKTMTASISLMCNKLTTIALEAIQHMRVIMDLERLIVLIYWDSLKISGVDISYSSNPKYYVGRDGERKKYTYDDCMSSVEHILSLHDEEEMFDVFITTPSFGSTLSESSSSSNPISNTNDDDDDDGSKNTIKEVFLFTAPKDVVQCLVNHDHDHDNDTVSSGKMDKISDASKFNFELLFDEKFADELYDKRAGLIEMLQTVIKSNMLLDSDDKSVDVKGK